jgi:hypothetical protein
MEDRVIRKPADHFPVHFSRIVLHQRISRMLGHNPICVSIGQGSRVNAHEGDPVSIASCNRILLAQPIRLAEEVHSLLLPICFNQILCGLPGEFTKSRLRLAGFSPSSSDVTFDSIASHARRGFPAGVNLADLSDRSSSFCLGRYPPRFLRGCGFDRTSASKAIGARTPAAARNALGNLRTPASAIRPLSARAATTRRHTGLVGIETRFDGALQLAQFGLDHTCAKEPVQAMELCADSSGMHEAVPLSDPADRVSARALAGISCQLNRHARPKCRASTNFFQPRKRGWPGQARP